MIDKLQQCYNTFIRQADLNYDHTKQEVFKEMHDVLLGKAEAWEDAANYLSHKFPEIKTSLTNRFRDTRDHHLTEGETEPKREKSEA